MGQAHGGLGHRDCRGEARHRAHEAGSGGWSQGRACAVGCTHAGTALGYRARSRRSPLEKVLGGLIVVVAGRLANFNVQSQIHRRFAASFGGDVDYAMLVKLYEHPQRRYSPAECIGARKERIESNPDMAHVSTSYAERNNLKERMHSRRMTRLTNAFSKKAANHAHAMALHFLYYNFVRIHK